MQYYPRFSIHVLIAARKEARHDAEALPAAVTEKNYILNTVKNNYE